MKPLLRLGAVALVCSATAHAQSVPPTPAPVTVVQDTGQSAPGYIFYTQQQGRTGVGNGPVITDNQGRPVWFHKLDSGVAGDFRVQTYQGKPVLTWAQGDSFQNAIPGTGRDYICDSSYHVIATVQAGNGLNADLHEFQLTPQGTALITIYHVVPMDLTSVGGAKDGLVLEGVMQEIDVATGRVLFEWHSLDHVGLDESYASLPATPTGMFDYFHINSVKLDTDGNYIVSARHTWTVYKVNRTTGAIMWRMGGKKSDFALGPGLPYAWQHNAVAVDASTIRLFDNEAGGTPSRILWVKHDDVAKTATIIREIQHPTGIAAWAEGNAEALPNGDTIVGWGVAGGWSEFDAANNLVFDVRQAPGVSSYRTYRFPWVAAPTDSPVVTAYRESDGTIRVHAIWNGATAVARWQVLGAPTPGAATAPVTTAPWNGLDTTISVPGPLASVAVVALDANGAALGTSAPLDGPFPGETPVITQQPASQTVAAGDTVVFSVTAAPATTYQWSHNGQPLADGTSAETTVSGATGPTVMLRGVTAADAGSYTCTVSNLGTATTSDAATLTVPDGGDASRIVNLSCRADAGNGDKALIVGFVVGGGDAAGTTSVLLRAAGPALAPFGISDPLANPELALYPAGSTGQPIASDDDWMGDPAVIHAADAVQAFTWNDPTSKDAALLTALAPGGYTEVVQGADGGAGVALAEAYDASAAAGAPSATAPRLINVSGRAEVGAGADMLMAGFVIAGDTAKTVLIRASGPALAGFGVNDALADPTLELHRADGTLLARNTDWAGDAQVTAAAASVGAFPWTNANSKDAAILVTLPPGEYSAQVSGANGGIGVALVEVYEVP